ncbi:thyroid receptor-interacting protein 6-like isoform X2 [Sagmatias obliquidens]|uniref:thyroid receptor-interacting protein 6-like isoform X2 n=1 Tax=Sagmatias obliquidens TaxID=3371155 RepID=UPI000F443F81|nr:thyroid receptor-interacting protein 6-like isoform X2 [Lagenorhynchus obliquidens]
MANQPHPPASPLRRWAGAGRSEKPSRSWHLSSRTSRTCGVRQQVHSPPGGRGTRAPGAVNVRLASRTATPRRNLIQRASLWFPASYREVQSPRAASLTGFTALRPGGDQRPPPPNPASSAPAAAPAGANRSSPASPPRRAGRHAAAADQWRGRRGGASPAPPIACPSPWGRGRRASRRRLAHARRAPAAMT